MNWNAGSDVGTSVSRGHGRRADLQLVKMRTAPKVSVPFEGRYHSDLLRLTVLSTSRNRKDVGRLTPAVSTSPVSTMPIGRAAPEATRNSFAKLPAVRPVASLELHREDQRALLKRTPARTRRPT